MLTERHVVAGANADRAGDRFTIVHVVDLFTGSAELTTRFTVSPDGFHPSDEGYKLIAERFLEVMRAQGIRLR